MHRDIIQFRDFYDRSPLGSYARYALRRALRGLWPGVRGEVVAGYGYPLPVLGVLRQEAKRVVALMPAEIGVCRWPGTGPNSTVLVDGDRLPIETGGIDRLVVLHGYASSPRPRELMREFHRILAPGGRVVFIAPNRTGLWARADSVPFGVGHPFTAGQLRRLLAEHAFEACAEAAALFMPPTRRRFWLRGARLFERYGDRFGARRFAGALLVEAVKLVYVPPRPTAAPMRDIVEALGGIAGSHPEPATGRSARVPLCPPGREGCARPHPARLGL